MKRRTKVTAAVATAVLLAGGGVIASQLVSGGGQKHTNSPSAPPATAEVRRVDLGDTKPVDGTLRFSGERTVNAGADGVVTWTPSTGSVIKRGEKLFEIDGKPVTLLYGAKPMYRELKTGVGNGWDVRQLEENLSALGYGGFTVDGKFTDRTAAALKRYQKDRGLPQTGKIGPDQVVFTSSGVRVKKSDASASDRVGPGKPVVTVTGTEHVVEVELGASDQGLARKGEKVDIDLPEGKKAQGTIEDIGAASSPGDSGEQGDKDKEPKQKVTVRLADGTGDVLKDTEQAPVTVHLVGKTHKDILTVPIPALLALPEGGYGLQVVDGVQTRTVKVELGVFAAGQVQVTGDGIKAGMKVGVPKS